jgi:hypothetical protein
MVPLTYVVGRGRGEIALRAREIGYFVASEDGREKR